MRRGRPRRSGRDRGRTGESPSAPAPSASPTERTARHVARHPGFPAGAGVAFAQVIDRETLAVRAWDRARLIY